MGRGWATYTYIDTQVLWRTLAERLRGEVQQQAWDRQADLEGRREAGMTRAEVEKAVMWGPRSEGGLLTSSLRGRGSRGAALVAAAAALGRKPSALPLDIRTTNGGASEHAEVQPAGSGSSGLTAEVQPAGSGSTSSGGEAMTCDDNGRDCVGDTG